MKQLAVLMALFLAVMLLITGVMAVGNARQSEQMVEKSKQISSLKADLRKVKKENKTLSAALDSTGESRARLLLEQQAVAERLRHALALLPGAATGVAPQPLPPEPVAGEALLQAMALEQALLRTGGAAVHTAAAFGAAAEKPQQDETPISWAVGGNAAGATGGSMAGPVEAATANSSGTDAGAAAVNKSNEALPCRPDCTCGCTAGAPVSEQPAPGTVAAISQVVELPVKGPRESTVSPAGVLALLEEQAERSLMLLDALSSLVHWASGQ